MATLNISVTGSTGAAIGVGITVQLTDSRMEPVSGFAAGGVLVAGGFATTDNNGEASFDLTPNADINPVGTFYTVTIGNKVFLIEKDNTEQTLEEALVESE